MRTALLTILLLCLMPALARGQVDSTGALYFQVLPEADSASATGVLLTGECGSYRFEPAPIMSLADVREAVPEQEGTDQYSVYLVLTDEGAAHLQRETERLLGHRVGVVVEGKLQAAAIVRRPLGERFPLTAEPISEAEATAVAADLNARIQALDGG